MLGTTKAISTATAATGVLLAGLVAVGPTPPAGATTGTFTQSQSSLVGDSFDSVTGGLIQINDSTLSGPRAASPYPAATAQLNGLSGTVTDVVLTLHDFDHQAPRDVDLMLVGPQGQRALVMSDVGGATPVTDVDLVFDDSSTKYLNFDDTPTSGTYHPSNDLAGDTFPDPAPSAAGVPSAMSVFDGTDPNGSWLLYVVDDLSVYSGQIGAWSVSVHTTGPAPFSSLTVAGATGALTDVDVELEIDHGRLSDVDLMLVGPKGQQVTLLSDAGGPNEVDAARFVLDDAAPAGVPNPVLPGTYRPTDVVEVGVDAYFPPAPPSDGSTLLSVFNGTDPNGTWRLYISDDSHGYRGYVAEWSLRLTTTDPVAPTTPTPTPSGSPAPAVDDRHPRVESTSPAHKAKRVRRGVSVTAVLDEPVRPATVTAATAYLLPRGSSRRVPALVTWSAASHRITVDPRRRLRADTTYRLVVTTAVTDLAGNGLDQDETTAGLQRGVWRFSTR